MSDAAFCFRPGWPRIFLETMLARSVADLGAAGGRCLNVGCGIEGRYADLLAGYDVDGVDIAEPQGRALPWRHHCCDAAALPFPDRTFDLAFAIESFEHIDDNRSAMREVARTLKPGGRLILTTPTHWTWIFELGRHGPHYYKRRELEALVGAAGMQVLEATGCGGLVYWLALWLKSWLSPVGLRLRGKRWWPMIDGALGPVYRLAWVVDRILPFPPSNWLVVAVRAED